ncbi:MAG: lipoxygenase family protein [Myxococcota bacterium]
MSTAPSLPQHDGLIARAARAAQLAATQKTLTYSYTTVVAPLGVAASVPKDQEVALVLAGTAVLRVLELVGNVLAKATKIFGEGAPRDERLAWSAPELVAVGGVVEELHSGHERLTELLTSLHARPARAGVRAMTSSKGLFSRVEGVVVSAVEDVVTGDLLHLGDPAEEAFDVIGKLFKALIRETGQLLLKYLDLYGEAPAIAAFAEQFQTIRVPEIQSNCLDDRMFAHMRVAGPNPLMIQGIRALPATFPVTDAQFQETMGAQDSLARAGAEGRLFLCDYAALSGVEAGTFPSQQKYLTAPLALFAVPPENARDRALRAVAIQLAQAPANDAPIFTPTSAAWPVAKLHVQVADGNYHEMISHLGLTHLVVEAFAVTTPRHLAEDHPLYLLLAPHLTGTVFINNAAVTSLISTGGIVDRILSGTIASSVKLSVDAVTSFAVNQQFLPDAMARRNVETLPVYPYRDDGLLVWHALHAWVQSYLAVYYPTDADVQGDYELQAWARELGSQDGGRLAGVAEPGAADGGIHTFGYLVDIVTLAMFTASAQHAAVNFPQNFTMSYTPALPLAAYAPPPVSPRESGSVLATLPPLQQSVVQQALGYLLGGVYYTRLGDYDRNLRGKWFEDPRVQAQLAQLGTDLRAVEVEIGRRNLTRIPYIVLLPSQIPQSINI